MTTEKLLLTALDAAKLMGISPRTLWALTKTGEIPRVPIGTKQYRYHVQDLEDWIAERKTSEPIVAATI